MARTSSSASMLTMRSGSWPRRDSAQTTCRKPLQVATCMTRNCECRSRIWTSLITIADTYRHCVDGNTEATLVSASSEDGHDHDNDHEDGAAVHASTTMTSVTSSVATGSTNSTASSTSTGSRTTTASSAPTAVTNCHAHDETELSCLDGSDEWQVTSDWDESNPPESFENCHAHGEEL
jgi:hypothetical protein